MCNVQPSLKIRATVPGVHIRSISQKKILSKSASGWNFYYVARMQEWFLKVLKKIPHKRDFRSPPTPNFMFFVRSTLLDQTTCLIPFLENDPYSYTDFKTNLVEIDPWGKDI